MRFRDTALQLSPRCLDHRRGPDRNPFPLLLILLGLSWLALVDSSTLWMTLNLFLQAGSGG